MLSVSFVFCYIAMLSKKAIYDMNMICIVNEIEFDLRKVVIDFIMYLFKFYCYVYIILTCEY